MPVQHPHRASSLCLPTTCFSTFILAGLKAFVLYEEDDLKRELLRTYSVEFQAILKREPYIA